jgi:hypothetical protein
MTSIWLPTSCVPPDSTRLRRKDRPAAVARSPARDERREPRSSAAFNRNDIRPSLKSSGNAPNQKSACLHDRRRAAAAPCETRDPHQEI